MRRNLWTAAGGLAVAAYLCGGRLIPLPDFFAGLLLGLGAVCLLMGQLPPLAREKLRRWKGRG